MNGKGTTRIILGGKLGALFGKEWNLYVNSPAEAIQAIDINLKGKLREYLSTKGGKKYYKIALSKKDNLLKSNELDNPTGENDIYVLPIVRGKSSGTGKILASIGLAIVGITLAVVGVMTGNIFLIKAGFMLANIADVLLIGGIVQLLTPVPKFNANTTNSDGGSRGSNIFEGNSVATSQGGAVGVVYGRMLVTPMPISLSYSNTDQVTSTDIPSTDYDTTENDGNIVEYDAITRQNGWNLA